jgi:hypothetical protein
MTETSSRMGSPVASSSDDEFTTKDKASAPDLETPAKCHFDINDIERLERDFGVRIDTGTLRIR